MKTLMTLAILTAVSFGSFSTFAASCPDTGSQTESGSQDSSSQDTTEKDNLRDGD